MSKDKKAVKATSRWVLSEIKKHIKEHGRFKYVLTVPYKGNVTSYYLISPLYTHVHEYFKKYDLETLCSIREVLEKASNKLTNKLEIHQQYHSSIEECITHPRLVTAVISVLGDDILRYADEYASRSLESQYLKITGHGGLIDKCLDLAPVMRYLYNAFDHYENADKKEFILFNHDNKVKVKLNDIVKETSKSILYTLEEEELRDLVFRMRYTLVDMLLYELGNEPFKEHSDITLVHKSLGSIPSPDSLEYCIKRHGDIREMVLFSMDEDILRQITELIIEFVRGKAGCKVTANGTTKYTIDNRYMEHALYLYKA